MFDDDLIISLDNELEEYCMDLEDKKTELLSLLSIAQDKVENDDLYMLPNIINYLINVLLEYAKNLEGKNILEKFEELIMSIE